MTTTASATEQLASTTPAPVKRGILFVHGVGDQRQSDFLLDVGEALIDWLARWHEARDSTPPRVTRSVLNFNIVDDDSPASHAVMTFDNGDVWVLTEAWWAASSRRQRFATMADWTRKHVRQAARALGLSFWQRLTGREQDTASVSPLTRWLLAFYTLGTLIGYLIGVVLGLPLVVALLILAQIPIPTVQQFILRLIQPFVEINLGEFRSILEDELQAANIRRRAADRVRDLVDRHGCADVVIVAHSGGAVVSFDMLNDRAYADAAGKVRKLITIGSGLNHAWRIAPDLARLHGPLPGHIHWIDFWASFDPAPAGWVRPPQADGTWRDVFAPSSEVVAAQGLTARADPNPYAGVTAATADAPRHYWPASLKVTNELSILTDHGTYWRNDEEVLTRLAAEIDSAYYRDSVFWKGFAEPSYDREEDRRIPRYAAPAETTLRAQVHRRRKRVIVLAWLRAAAIALWILSLPLASDPVARWLDEHAGILPIPAWLAFITPDWLAGSSRYAVAALILGLPFLLAFRFVRYRWERYDRRCRDEAIAAIATARDPSGTTALTTDSGTLASASAAQPPS